MLVITRGESETLCIGDEIRVTVKRVSGGRVQLAVSALPHVRVLRCELGGPLEGEREGKPEGVACPIPVVGGASVSAA